MCFVTFVQNFGDGSSNEFTIDFSFVKISIDVAIEIVTETSEDIKWHGVLAN